MDALKQETERLLQIAESPVHGNYTLQRFAEHIRNLQEQVDAAQELADNLADTLRCLEWHTQRNGVGMDKITCIRGREAIAKWESINE